MLNRNEIEDKYKWDLTLLFKTEKEVNGAKKKVKEGIDKLKEYEGKLKTKENVLCYFKESEEVEKMLLRLDLFASLKISIDTTDPQALKLMEEVNGILTYYSVSLAFVSPELSRLSDELLDEMKKDKIIPFRALRRPGYRRMGNGCYS